MLEKLYKNTTPSGRQSFLPTLMTETDLKISPWINRLIVYS
ncbi:hypothetical protein MAMP_01347 [Methylophaga aminisulfidivorans MP]|uniref:Uncharacterized protein n=1 Tax=Methylophaga aminisulfidivorans MP TaxID=1026882 RepID=F5SZ60_9GAMM|nr:hypothetical protein MAMP_01347 [Methylophaga aminisulfidivorans MP]